MTEKLQKALARAGIVSRREAERLISAERVTVNGELAHLGQRIDPHAQVCIDGKAVTLTHDTQIKHQTLIYHKPIGKVCTRSDDQGRVTVFEDFPELQQARWILVGRLDINTSGLLLITTDGELANRLMHPSYQIKREYLVDLKHKASVQDVEQLKLGVQLEDGPAKFSEITTLGDEQQKFIVSIHEGRKREVRRLWQAVGNHVQKLKRINYGCVSLPKDLHPGRIKPCGAKQLQALYQSVQLTYSI